MATTQPFTCPLCDDELRGRLVITLVGPGSQPTTICARHLLRTWLLDTLPLPTRRAAVADLSYQLESIRRRAAGLPPIDWLRRPTTRTKAGVRVQGSGFRCQTDTRHPTPAILRFLRSLLFYFRLTRIRVKRVVAKGGEAMK